ncbi:hypothetical protein GJR99_11980 [Haloferax sp. MBLA0078]|uniref:Uncharacterized protein n=1 Tax=Haloferax marinum TaxID=2666143 RepID=A0A6A8G8S6_9EURY|nr:hypothetical protein Hfx1150_12025 [Haloferax sp. CBA1150]MRW97287.1 hypothetical protein [Haloferax marinum]
MGAYPSSTEMGTEYDAWVGEQASLAGTVVETDPVTITDEYRAGEHVTLQVVGADVDAQQGDRLAVFGVVEEDHTIRALNAYTVPPSNYLYMYAVSFVAGVWVLGRLVRTWRLDWASWSLEPRSTPLRLSNISVWSQETEEPDA